MKEQLVRRTRVGMIVRWQEYDQNPKGYGEMLSRLPIKHDCPAVITQISSRTASVLKFDGSGTDSFYPEHNDGKGLVRVYTQDSRAAMKYLERRKQDALGQIALYNQAIATCEKLLKKAEKSV